MYLMFSIYMMPLRPNSSVKGWNGVIGGSKFKAVYIYVGTHTHNINSNGWHRSHYQGSNP